MSLSVGKGIVWSAQACLRFQSGGKPPHSMVILVGVTLLASVCEAQTPRLLSPADVEAHAQRPAFSPDGKRLAFELSASESRKDQYVVSTAGGKPVILAPGGGSRFSGAAAWVCHEATWDPSGRPRLVLSCGERGVGNYDLHLAEVFGDQATLSRLTTDEANEGSPAWARLRGADLLYFTSSKSGNGDLYRLDLGVAGAVPVRVTRTAATDDFAVFSPDVQTFLFVQRTSRSGGEGVYSGRVDAPGEPSKVADWPGSDETNPSFSPDGTQVAFYSNKGHRAKGGREAYDLYVVPASGGTPRLVIAGVNKSDGLGPAWTPDGTAFVVALSRARTLDPLALVATADGKVTPLATGTEMNGDAIVSRVPGATLRIVFSAQGRAGDPVKRWRRLYLLEIPK